jgi:hypothetical protein
MGASTPTHRTQVCVTWWGTDSVETGLSLLSVHPSGQQILSTLTSVVNATTIRTATSRTNDEYSAVTADLGSPSSSSLRVRHPWRVPRGSTPAVVTQNYRPRSILSPPSPK